MDEKNIKGEKRNLRLFGGLIWSGAFILLMLTGAFICGGLFFLLLKIILL